MKELVEKYDIAHYAWELGKVWFSVTGEMRKGFDKDALLSIDSNFGVTGTIEPFLFLIQLNL